MKLRYFSDLHLEFIESNNIEQFITQISIGNIDEVCILAGDIGNPYQSNYDVFMTFISNNFIKTFVISGNHEYYGTTEIHITNAFMKNYFHKFNNITFLDNSYEFYRNFCFVGTTLWSKITNPNYKINDVYKIPNFNYIEYNRLNMLCVDFLEYTLCMNAQFIVITHHIPSNDLINVKYKTQQMRPYNQYFYCNMDQFIEQNANKIKCWIYGHTHTPSNVIIHEVPFLCNPIGYPNENKNINFEQSVII